MRMGIDHNCSFNLKTRASTLGAFEYDNELENLSLSVTCRDSTTPGVGRKGRKRMHAIPRHGAQENAFQQSPRHQNF